MDIIGEYVEPGRSGTEMTKRIAFQEVLERIRRTKDIDHIIVYEARPAGPISKSKVAAMLKDPYYLGLVKYKGQTYDGRHPALISQELFDRVQDLLEARGYAGERRRRNHHYLKGKSVLWQVF